MKWRATFTGSSVYDLRDEQGRTIAKVWPADDDFGRPRHMGQERWFSSVLNAAVDATAPLHATPEAAKDWCDKHLGVA